MSGPGEPCATLLKLDSAFHEDAVSRAIGDRLREERRRQRLTLQSVADRSGLSRRDDLQFDGQVPHGQERLNGLPIRFLSITVELDPDERIGER